MRFLLLCLLVFSTTFAQADDKTFSGFVQIRKDRELYVDWVKAAPGKPTAILLNGLTYSTKQWDRFTQALSKRGIGVLRYDMYGMGQTLLKYAPLVEAISYKQQAQDLNALTNVLGIKGKLNLVGLSYGGGIAMAFSQFYSERVGVMVLMAPYTEPIEEQDRWIRSQIWYTRKLYPLHPASDDELYDYFLRQIVYTTYPAAEPIVLENSYKLEAVFRMVQGIRKWTALSAANSFPAKSVHLMIAGNDQYIKRQVMDDFWAGVPEESKASVIVVNNTEHKIPEAAPNFSAAWVAEILMKNRILNSVRNFEGDAITGVVRYEGGSFKLPHN